MFNKSLGKREENRRKMTSSFGRKKNQRFSGGGLMKNSKR